MISIKVGEKIPLILQVRDGNQDLNPTAILIDQFNNEYMRVKLNHQVNGMYCNFQINMPDLDLLVAQYVCDHGDYEVAQDIFKSVPKPIKTEKMIYGEVIQKGLWDDTDIIFGEVTNEEET